MAVLARHGIDPAADETTLTAALAARGWQASVEETDGVRPRDRNATARWRRDRGAGPYPGHLQHTGPTAVEALATVLARDDGRGERP